MITLNRFLCFRLQTAGVIIGWIGAVGSLLNVITYSIIISRLDIILDNIFDKDSSENIPTVKTLALTILSIYIAINIVDCLASALLVAGTLQERHPLLVPWLLNGAVSITFNVLNVGSSAYVMISGKETAWMVIIVALIGMVAIVIQFFIWLAIYSLFKFYRMSSEQQRLIPGDKIYQGPPSYTRI